MFASFSFDIVFLLYKPNQVEMNINSKKFLQPTKSSVIPRSERTTTNTAWKALTTKAVLLPAEKTCFPCSLAVAVVAVDLAPAKDPQSTTPLKFRLRTCTMERRSSWRSTEKSLTESPKNAKNATAEELSWKCARLDPA